MDPFDEPTYLTFAIDFRFEHTNTVVSGPINNLWGSQLFGEDDGSAVSFLKDRGYTAQANGLSVFKKILRYLTFNAPWYFQTITGLNNLWTQGTNIEGGQKAKDVSIEIETLEAIDLRITELADIYRNAIYDKVHLRERVPDNLRWFSMDIYLAEARNMRFNLPGIGQNVANLFGVNTGDIGNIVGGGNLVSNVLKQYGYIKFKCRQCEFDFSRSLGGNNYQFHKAATPTEVAKNSFKINIGYFEEESKYADGSKLYDDALRTSINNPWSSRNVGTDVQNAASFLSGLPVIGDGIADAGDAVKGAFSSIGGLINPALGAASNFLDPPVQDLGNIYGNE